MFHYNYTDDESAGEPDSHSRSEEEEEDSSDQDSPPKKKTRTSKKKKHFQEKKERKTTKVRRKRRTQFGTQSQIPRTVSCTPPSQSREDLPVNVFLLRWKKTKSID